MATGSLLRLVVCLGAAALTGWVSSTTAAAAELPQYPPQLTGGVEKVTLSGPKLLEPAETLRAGVGVAKVAPRVQLMYYPGQDYAGRPWSCWGDGLVVGDVFYSAIGDHLAPEGNAYVYRYDSRSGDFERIVDVRQIIRTPAGHYSPGKIHSRLTLGSDGWLYFSTHRGSTRVTTPENHFTGDWILRHHPERGVSEVVVHAPLENQCLPTGRLDPQRLVFYAGTADGDRTRKLVRFLAYDVKQKRVLYADDTGPYRAMILSNSSGRVYFQQQGGRGQVLPLVRFDPAKPGPPEQIDARVGLRAASEESSQGLVYTVDGNHLWEFNTRTEQAREIGETLAGDQEYITSLDLDPQTERYLYYIAGAHGGAWKDGSPLVQYDLRTNRRKVICFLGPACHEAAGFMPMGTYGMALSPAGDRVYVTWNGAQTDPRAPLNARLRFNTCALTVIDIPAEERPR